MERNLMIQLLVLVFIGPACSLATSKPMPLSEGGKGVEVRCMEPTENCHKAAAQICTGAYKIHNMGFVDPLSKAQFKERSMLLECLDSARLELGQQKANSQYNCKLPGLACYRL